MDKKKYLVIGASGLIGSHLYKCLVDQGANVIGTYFNDKQENLIYLDMCNVDLVNNLFDSYEFDVVLLPAANPNVEWCEKNPEKSFEINVIGTSNIIKQCKKRKTKLVFYSSEYVFDGKNGPYSEEDIPNPINIYGKHKLISEYEIMKNLSNYLILRTTVVFGKEKKEKNFVYGLIYKTSRKEKIFVPNDQISSPTYVQTIVTMTFDLINNKSVGIYHVAGSNILDRYNFALKIADEFNLNKDYIIPVSSSQLNQSAKRPLNAGLKIDKIVDELDYKLSAFSLKKVLRKAYLDYIDILE